MSGYALFIELKLRWNCLVQAIYMEVEQFGWMLIRSKQFVVDKIASNANSKLSRIASSLANSSAQKKENKNRIKTYIFKTFERNDEKQRIESRMSFCRKRKRISVALKICRIYFCLESDRRRKIRYSARWHAENKSLFAMIARHLKFLNFKRVNCKKSFASNFQCTTLSLVWIVRESEMRKISSKYAAYAMATKHPLKHCLAFLLSVKNP